MKKAATAAQKDFIVLMKKECNEDVKLTIKVNDDAGKMLPPPPSGGPGAFSAGGVKLTACNGRLVCDNSLDTRLKLIYEEQMPLVRGMRAGVGGPQRTHSPTDVRATTINLSAI